MEINNSSQKSKYLHGTVVVGIVCKDCVIIGADQLMSAGDYPLFFDKKKIFSLNKYCYCAFTGVVSTIKETVDILRAELKLNELSNRKVIIESIASLAGILLKERNADDSNGGAVGLIAGYDSKPQLFDIDGGGAIDKAKYSASKSSGIFQATTILDENYHDNMTEQEGIELCVRAIQEAKRRAPGVGGFSMDVAIINKQGSREISQKEINAILVKNKNYLLQKEREISKQ